MRKELDREALISVSQSTFKMILSTPRENLVEILNGLIKRGHLIIWNPDRNELIKEGDIIKADILNGKTVKLTLAEEEIVDFKKWMES